MVETILFLIVIGTIILWLLPFLIPLFICTLVIKIITAMFIKHKESKLNESSNFSLDMGKEMMKKDMIDSMFDNKNLDNIEKTIIAKNIFDDNKK